MLNDHSGNDLQQQSLTQIRQSLAQLPSRTRTAFALFRSSRLTRSQIANRLDVPLTVVDTMIADAIAALKSCRAKIDSADAQP